MKNLQPRQKLLDCLYVIFLVMYVLGAAIILFGPNGNWYAIKGWRALFLFIPTLAIFILYPLSRRNLVKKTRDEKRR